jgi:hypothetical protein
MRNPCDRPRLFTFDVLAAGAWTTVRSCCAVHAVAAAREQRAPKTRDAAHLPAFGAPA